MEKTSRQEISPTEALDGDHIAVSRSRLTAGATARGASGFWSVVSKFQCRLVGEKQKTSAKIDRQACPLEVKAAARNPRYLACSFV
jgi:hypothetical protein